jgi:hypothetical protein
MIKTVVFTSLLIFLFSQLSAQTSEISPGKATVYFMRSTGKIGHLEAFNTFIDDTIACKLNNNSYNVHQVPAGLHKFQVRANGKNAKHHTALNITLEVGQTYYIAVDLTDRAITAAIFLTEVTINTANKMLPKLKQDTNCKTGL